MPTAARRRPLVVLAIAVLLAAVGFVFGGRGGGSFTSTATIILEDPQASASSSVIGPSPDRYVNDQVAVFGLDEHHVLAAELANEDLGEQLAEGSTDATTLGDPRTVTVQVDGQITAGAILQDVNGFVSVPAVPTAAVVRPDGSLVVSQAPVLDERGIAIAAGQLDQVIVREDGFVAVNRAGAGVVGVAPDGTPVLPTVIAEGEEPDADVDDTEGGDAGSGAALGFTVDVLGTVRLDAGELVVEIFDDGRAVLRSADETLLRQPDDAELIGPAASRILVGASFAVATSIDSTVAVDLDAGTVVLDPVAQVVSASPGAVVSPAQSPLEGVETLDADAIDEGLVVTSSPDTFVLEVNFQAVTEELAVAGANGSVDAFRQLRDNATIGDNAAALARADNTIGELTAELLEVEARLTSLRAVAGTDTPLDRQYQDILDEIATVGASLVADDVNSDVETARIQQLLVQLGAIEQIARIELQQPDIAEAVAESASLRTRIEQLEAQRDTLSVGAGTGSGIALSSPARDAEQTTGLGSIRLAVVGLILGALIGVAVAYVLELRRPATVESPVEIERILDEPLIAEIPDYRHERIESLVPVLEAPDTGVAEAYRISAAALHITARSKKTRVVGFVSATVGAGKTAVVSNLAIALAQSDRNVLVIDSDLEGRALGGILRRQAGFEDLHAPGIADILRGETTFAATISTMTLAPGVEVDLVPAGTDTSAARLAVSADLWTRIFSEARRSNYDLVLVDVAPLLGVAYASRVLNEVQGTVVVVPFGSKLETTQELRDRLDFVGAPKLGFLLNRSRLRRERSPSVAISELLDGSTSGFAARFRRNRASDEAAADDIEVSTGASSEHDPVR